MIREHREELGLNVCCQALVVSKGTWHYRQQRRKAGPDSEEERIKEAVREIIAEHPSYGYRRIRAVLEERLGERINHKRLVAFRLVDICRGNKKTHGVPPSGH